MKFQCGISDIDLLFLYHRHNMGWVNATPRPFYLGDRSSSHRTGGWVGQTAGMDGYAKRAPPPGFDPQTVQPITRRYTD